jgi:hypothetical protein
MSRTFAAGQRLSRASSVVTALPMSFAAWVYVTSFTGTSGFVGISISTGAVGTGWHLYGDTAGVVWAEQVSATSGASAAQSTAKLSLSTWTHVAAVFTSGTSRAVYINGANKISDTVSVSTTSGTTTTLIASVYETAFFDCLGSIAFVGIWNVALADAEVAELGNGISPLGVRPSALKSYAPLVSGASPEPDLIGSTYTLTGSSTLNASNPKIVRPV